MKRLLISAAVISLFSQQSLAQKFEVNGESTYVSPKAKGSVHGPATQLANVPEWYLQVPTSTDEYMWFSGTGISTDLSMSREKAILDAQVKLADTLSGTANALIKHYKGDETGTVTKDRTSITVKKLIIDTSVTGYQIEESVIVVENKGYRSFVLLRFPIGDTNALANDRKQQFKQRDNMDDGQQELDQEIRNQKKISSTLLPNDVVRPVVATGDSFALAEQVALVKTDNKAYVQARDEALKKPGAVVLQQTFN